MANILNMKNIINKYLKYKLLKLLNKFNNRFICCDGCDNESNWLRRVRSQKRSMRMSRLIVKKHMVARQKCDSQCPPRLHRSTFESLKPEKKMYIELPEDRSYDRSREPDSFSPLLWLWAIPRGQGGAERMGPHYAMLWHTSHNPPTQFKNSLVLYISVYIKI